MAVVDQFSSFARSLSSLHLQDNNMPFEGRDDNTLRQSNNRLPRSESPTSAVIGKCRANYDMPQLPFPAIDSCSLHQHRTSSMKRLSKVERRREATVTFAPMPPPCGVAASKGTKLKRRCRATAASVSLPPPCVSTPTPAVAVHKGFRKDYELGERLRSLSHTIAKHISDENIASLQKHDFSFIKRSDGSYTYSILACRDEEGERMTFVLDNNGSTKVIRKKHWKKFVCLVSA